MSDHASILALLVIIAGFLVGSWYVVRHTCDEI
jgi:hypothetical protein